MLMDFCLIFVPFGHYDEPEILRYANTSICPKGADVRHKALAKVRPKVEASAKGYKRKPKHPAKSPNGSDGALTLRK